jgi:serine phosphatase RsbU (regulator of sigma subunit)
VQTSAEAAIDALLEAAHTAAPYQLPELLAEHAAALGARDAVAYLVDLQQVELVPFLSPSAEGSRPVIPVDGSEAGRAYQLMGVVSQAQAQAGGLRVWYPMLDGTERVGVLAVTLPGPGAMADEVLQRRLRRFASMSAELVVTKALYGDDPVRVRRRAPMTLAAEIQWGLLPPLTFACRQVVVAAALEPAYDVAGDSVDYAVDAGRTRFAVFDAMGHGMTSAQLASLAVAAYRNGRRTGLELEETAEVIDAVVERSPHDGFVTGLLAELDTDTGVLSWVAAGHPEPLLVREGQLVRGMHVDPGLPFGLGLGQAQYPVASERLRPGDRVLLFTDGITEARGPAGELFGVERLVDLVARHCAEGLPAPETMRRLVRAVLAHQQGRLDDDATLLMVEWRTGTQELLLP